MIPSEQLKRTAAVGHPLLGADAHGPMTEAAPGVELIDGDFVVMGGQSGVVGHIKIGTGAQIAGWSHATHDVPPGARVGGTPAVPMVEYGRQIAILKRWARRGGGSRERG